MSTFTGIQTQRHPCWANQTSGDAKSSTQNHRCCVLANNTSLESKAKPVAFTSSLRDREGIEQLAKDTGRKDQTGAESQAFNIPQTGQCQERGGTGPRTKNSQKAAAFLTTSVGLIDAWRHERLGGHLGMDGGLDDVTGSLVV